MGYNLGKGFFSTNNYGVYFYLIGSLLFYFQMCQQNNFSNVKTGLLLLFFIIIAILLVYIAQPNFN